MRSLEGTPAMAEYVIQSANFEIRDVKASGPWSIQRLSYAPPPAGPRVGSVGSTSSTTKVSSSSACPSTATRKL